MGIRNARRFTALHRPLPKVIIISHRGNTNGESELTANSPDAVSALLDKGIHCEVDVWRIFDKYFLGHDEPKYKINKKFLKNDKLWCHAKNLESLQGMLDNNIHCFWHQTDDYTLTSKGYIWTFPKKEVCNRSVIVHKGPDWRDKYNCYAVCTDYPLK